MAYFVGVAKFTAVAVFAFVLSGSNSLTRAADYKIVPVVSKAYVLNTSTEVPVPNINSQVGTPFTYQIDYYLNTSGFNSGLDQRGFGNLVFDVNRTGGLTIATGTGWTANNPTIDSNGGDLGGSAPLWDTNDQFSATPLQDIIVAIAVIPSPHVADPRPKAGQPPSLASTNFMGSVFINWGGTGTQTLTAAPEAASFARISNGQFQVESGATFQSGIVVFGVPEPSTFVLVGMAIPALGLLAALTHRKSALNA